MTTVDSILAWYDGSEQQNRDAAEWYGRGRAHVRRLARDYGVTESTAAGVIAALSPRIQWAVNLRAAESVLEHAAIGIRITMPVVGGFGANRDKAWRIALGERPLSVLGGLKVRAFYRNLMGQLDHVTVDVWAARAAGIEHVSITAAEYMMVAEAYTVAAQRRNVRPAEMQAVVWVAIRGRST